MKEADNAKLKPADNDSFKLKMKLYKERNKMARKAHQHMTTIREQNEGDSENSDDKEEKKRTVALASKFVEKAAMAKKKMKSEKEPEEKHAKKDNLPLSNQ